MGRVLSYSGISTKIRAMQSKLISESEIQEMLQFTSVSHAAAWLKRTPEYAKAWADLDENSLHRGQIEKLLKASIFKDFSKILVYHERLIGTDEINEEFNIYINADERF